MIVLSCEDEYNNPEPPHFKEVTLLVWLDKTLTFWHKTESQIFILPSFDELAKYLQSGSKNKQVIKIIIIIINICSKLINF